MCFWGEAYVLGPNINVPMDASANAPALAALERAQALAGHANDKEQALIAALAKRYSADPRRRPARARQSLGGCARRCRPTLSGRHRARRSSCRSDDGHPALGLLDGRRRQAKGRANEIVAELERAMAKNPDHPGAIHLYIHAVEASDRPERAEAGADRLAALIPGAGHIVHMPSHIYYRVGRYRDALAANKAAVAADEAYIAARSRAGLTRSRIIRTTCTS